VDAPSGGRDSTTALPVGQVGTDAESRHLWRALRPGHISASISSPWTRGWPAWPGLPARVYHGVLPGSW